MDVYSKLDELISLIENARALPMSASCVINRTEALGLIREVSQLVPEEFQQAELLLREREAILSQARTESEQLLARAGEQQEALLSDAEITRAAQIEAERVHVEAVRNAEHTRQQAEDYIDAKLANFEVVLTKTLAAVQRGREKMRGRSEMADLTEQLPDAESGYGGGAAPDTEADRLDDDTAYFDTGYIDTRIQ